MIITRLGVIGLSIYVVYLGLKCPCDKLMDCSVPQFHGSLLAMEILLFLERFVLK